MVRDASEPSGAGLGGVFPDLPGCVTQGDTPRHAAEMALEAVALHVESMVEDGEALPEPPPPDAVPDWLDPTETKVVTHLLVPVDRRGAACAWP